MCYCLPTCPSHPISTLSYDQEYYKDSKAVQVLELQDHQANILCNLQNSVVKDLFAVMQQNETRKINSILTLNTNVMFYGTKVRAVRHVPRISSSGATTLRLQQTAMTT